MQGGGPAVGALVQLFGRQLLALLPVFGVRVLLEFSAELKACRIQYIIHVNECGLVESDVHEGGLHPGQDPLDPALVYIAGNTGFIFSFNKDFDNGAVFQQGNPGFMGGGIYNKLFQHGISYCFSFLILAV